MDQYEQEKAMPDLTSIERLAFKEALEKGRLEGQLRVIAPRRHFGVANQLTASKHGYLADTIWPSVIRF